MPSANGSSSITTASMYRSKMAEPYLLVAVLALSLSLSHTSSAHTLLGFVVPKSTPKFVASSLQPEDVLESAIQCASAAAAWHFPARTHPDSSARHYACIEHVE